MPKKKLSHRLVKGLDPPEKQIEYYDERETGLILRLSKAGTKTFAYRYRFKGKNRRFTIGKFPAISLSDARAKVRELKVEINNGIDPQAQKKKRKYKPKELTFKELADIFSKQHLPTLAESTQKEYQRIIKAELLDKHNWGNIAVSEFTDQHVRKVLNQKGYEEGKFTMANRIRSTISKIFEFGLKKVGIKLNVNPVANTSLFEQGENVRDRVYNENEIKELWEFWETKPEPIQSYYKMLLLSGQRKTETMRMKWSDIEREKPCKRIEIKEDGRPQPKAFLADIWTIRYNKSDRIHEVPLSEMALELLDKLKPITGESEYIFESPINDGQPLTSVKKTTEKIQDLTSVSDFRLHDLRRTVATKLEESLVEQIVIEKILNHKAEGVTGKHYQWYNYTDKKLKALNRWSWRVKSIISGEKAEIENHKTG
ncbi:integrase arm-type DNA-binding domain-containing protein [Aliifodinibius sp. S!AR15-10]|uniref:tyrosine-type recombinase/integrase n=1 Tax=Aliifodinibius sp. S!AR15-10 TaxID=2950437 RepID=UPI0028557A23|nr:integrase arm-type DNA-binding domain-containing protein [Aliifodinibius sp. S!AR15-10]MDR8394078.1 integrase arm-type DNA-binding domain-containing protein [Aliifodinibius sp. S!AR15-10]